MLASACLGVLGRAHALLRLPVSASAHIEHTNIAEANVTLDIVALVTAKVQGVSGADVDVGVIVRSLQLLLGGTWDVVRRFLCSSSSHAELTCSVPPYHLTCNFDLNPI